MPNSKNSRNSSEIFGRCSRPYSDKTNSFFGIVSIERCHLLFGKYDRVFGANDHYDFCFDIFGLMIDVDVIKQSEKIVFIFAKRIVISEPISEFIEGTDITSCSIYCSVISQIVSRFDKNGSNCLTFKRETKYSSWKRVIFFLVFMLCIWISLIFMLSKNQTWSFMIHFFEIVSTLLLAFYISDLLMTIALNLANAARSENLLIISCLTVCKKPLISMFFVTCIILAVIIGRLNLVVLLFIIPGSCAFAINDLSKNLIKWYLW